MASMVELTGAPLQFTSSSRYTLGVEVEFQTLERESLNLAPLAPLLFAGAPNLLKPRLAEELIRSILEVRTGVCFSLKDVEYDLQQTISLAAELAAENGALLHCASLHPFARIEDQELTDNPRYQRIMEDLQLVGRQFISQGFHVHVGMPDAETAIKVLTSIQAYLPLLLAASTSSPFFQGTDTGLMSYRTKLFEMLPLAGIYGYLKNWCHYTDEVSRLVEYGVIGSLSDLWWDARLNPGFGTLEVRICDLPGRFQDILTLAALIQSLAATLAETGEGPDPIDPYLLAANKWQAARYGLQGWFIDPCGRLSTAKEKIVTSLQQLVTIVRPMSVRLGCERYLEQLNNIISRGTAAQRLREVYAVTGDMREGIRILNNEFWM